MKKFLYDKEVTLIKMRAVAAGVSEETLKEGEEWYPKAHEYAEWLAGTYAVPLEVTSGIIAVLSPMKNWYENLRISKEFLDSGGKICSHTGVQTKKARTILGMSRNIIDPVKWVDWILKGKKTQSFFHNILNPADNSYITIDTHMLELMTGDNERSKITDNQYGFLKNCILDYAAELDMSPVVLQAILWLQWRKMKKSTGKYTEISTE